ncbi:MAG: TolC family protein [Acidobacteriota bacterium]
MKSVRTLMLPLAACVAGCAPHAYRAAPISPPAIAAQLAARNLDDPGLRAWMRQAAGFDAPSWPLATWDLHELTLAAYYFNPQMDVARANAAVAAAAIQTAAMKPNPSVSIGPGYESAPESPYLFAFDFSLPIETAGKRGYRIAAATHMSEASRIQIAATAWSVRSQLRAALVNLVFARETVALLESQQAAQSHSVHLLEARLRAGEIPLPEVTTARIGLANVRQAVRAAEGQVEAARAEVAAAIGIPLGGLDGKIVAWPGLDAPPAPSTLPAASIRAEAVFNRLDVRRALASYQAAQSSLQLEVARQYPDLNLGPGYAFEEGAQLISLQLGAMLPLRNRNQGPIAEAEARRKAAGAQLLATQSSVIAQTDAALAQYHSAFAVLEEARRTLAEVEAQHHTTTTWFQQGETGRLATVLTDVQVAIALRAQLDAVHQAQLALGSLEDALQRPLDPGNVPALPRQAPRP